MKKDKDSYNYKGWMNSDHAIKRALATTGYNLLGMLIFYCALALVAGVIWLLYAALHLK